MKLIKFQDLSLQEKKEVLEWRNNPEIRKWMYNKKEIPLKNHLEFIESLKENPNKIYLKAEDLGVINFEIKNNLVEVGVHKNPKKEKVGKKLLEIAINYAFEKLKVKKITLFVFEKNQKAINLYKKFGFKQTDKKNNLIKMELRNEDRKH